ncbi:uncharacterized protein LOC109612572 [Musca domestica]|uniref:Uncharacterized protein LOC109612572 n=1 Tax=Musca domestica TaxID=7370 RepID=A0A9J7DFT9_MUSDO|nr:uncharacterized protein LOC109612572 [Musca domestica]
MTASKLVVHRNSKWKVRPSAFSEMTNNNVESEDIKNKPEWLNEELFREFLEEDFPNFQKISQFYIKPAVAAGENYMTVLLRVEISVEMSNGDKETVSYMVKIKPNVERLQVMIKEWQIFLKEHTTYTRYIPKFECYYSEVGRPLKMAPRILLPQRKHQITDDLLILEDLRLRGFKNFNRHTGLDMIHTKAVLTKLAQFHAASAHYALEEEEFPAMYDQCFTAKRDLFQDHRLRIGKIFRENLNLYGGVEHLEEKMRIFAETKSDPFQMKSERDPEEFNVLNHGDLWVNNIMFQYNDDGTLKETYFIDFQMGRYGPPAQDLIYFILSSTSVDIKLQYFDYFITYYHQKLIENLELLKYKGKLPKLKDLQMSLFKHDYWAYTTISTLMPIILCEARDDANVDNLLGESGDEFRRAMYRGPNFVKSMEVLLPWLDNRGAFDL